MYSCELRCTFNQSFNTLKAHVFARMSLPDSPKLNIGVTGFEHVFPLLLIIAVNYIGIHAAYSDSFS